MSIELAVVRVHRGWRVFGANFRSRIFAFKADAVDSLFDIAQMLTAFESNVILLVEEAGELVPVDQTADRAGAGRSSQRFTVEADVAAHRRARQLSRFSTVHHAADRASDLANVHWLFAPNDPAMSVHDRG